MAQQTANVSFPTKEDEPRLEAFSYYEKLYDGNHFDAFSIKGEQEFSERYRRLRYIVLNFASLISDVMAAQLFGEQISVTVTDKDNQKFVDGFMEDNQMHSQLYESAIGNSSRGSAVFKLRVGKRDPNRTDAKDEIIAEELDPAIYFPEFGKGASRNRPTKDVLAWVFEQDGKNYLHKEIHTAGKIEDEFYEYDPKEKKIISAKLPGSSFDAKDGPQETKATRSLVFYIPNYRTGRGFWGKSDYQDLSTIFFALNNRMTKIDEVLDRHGDPILAVPDGVFDENGKPKVSQLKMFEVSGDNEGFNKPEYIVWDAELKAAFEQIDKLVELAFMLGQVAPASLGVDKDGQAESGRALKFKLLSTLRRANQKRLYYDQAIKDMFETAMELSKGMGVEIDGIKVKTVERPKIDWSDGVVDDETELIENTIKEVEGGIRSRAEAIAKVRKVSPDEAEDILKKIDKESDPKLTVDPNKAGGDDGQNGNTPPNQNNQVNPTGQGANQQKPSNKPAPATVS